MIVAFFICRTVDEQDCYERTKDFWKYVYQFCAIYVVELFLYLIARQSGLGGYILGAAIQLSFCLFALRFYLDYKTYRLRYDEPNIFLRFNDCTHIE